jgi:hypothetical protein
LQKVWTVFFAVTSRGVGWGFSQGGKNLENVIDPAKDDRRGVDMKPLGVDAKLDNCSADDVPIDFPRMGIKGIQGDPKPGVVEVVGFNARPTKKRGQIDISKLLLNIAEPMIALQNADQHGQDTLAMRNRALWGFGNDSINHFDDPKPVGVKLDDWESPNQLIPNARSVLDVSHGSLLHANVAIQAYTARRKSTRPRQTPIWSMQKSTPSKLSVRRNCRCQGNSPPRVTLN